MSADPGVEAASRFAEVCLIASAAGYAIYNAFGGCLRAAFCLVLGHASFPVLPFIFSFLFSVLRKYLLTAWEMLHGGNVRKLEEGAGSDLLSSPPSC